MLTTSRVQEELAVLRSAGRSLQPPNHHRAAIRGFVLRAVTDGRMRDDPPRDVAGYNVKGDRRHDRRTISVDGPRRLIQVAASGPELLDMTGPARALCYRLAVATGLRFSEIASIMPESFDLIGKPPTVTVPAAYPKDGDPAVLASPMDLAVDLGPFGAAVGCEQPVFRLPRNDGAEMPRHDLTPARIPYCDDSGRVFGFDALRCMLADQAGTPPRIVKLMRRHFKREMTDRYTRPRLHDIQGATALLPSLRPARPPR